VTTVLTQRAVELGKSRRPDVSNPASRFVGFPTWPPRVLLPREAVA
jgi:hypothetical protein